MRRKKAGMSRRISGGFAVIITMTIVVGLLLLSTLKNVDVANRILYTTYAEPIGQLGNLSYYFQGMRVDLRDINVAENLEQLNAARKSFEENSQAFQEINAYLKEKFKEDASFKSIFDQIDLYYAEYTNMVNEYIKEALIAQKGNPQIDMTEFIRSAKSLRSNVEMLSLKLTEAANDANKETSENTRLVMNIASLILIACASIAIIIASLIRKNITSALGPIIKRLTNTVDYVSLSANQMAGSSQQLAGANTEQAASLEETSASMEETTSMVKQNTENTKQAAALSNQAKEAATKGVIQMKNMSTSMEEIKKSSSQIAKIIKVIEDIAFQTNILALNAAVEAARAGEAGQGFAVVAEEVRNLAQRSAQAAKDTTEIIERNIELSKHGVSIGEEVGVSLEDITERFEKVSTIIEEISVASEEQLMGISQIYKAIDQMEQVTQQNAAISQESAATSEDLNAQVERIEDIVFDLILFFKGSQENLEEDEKAEKNYKPKDKGRENIKKHKSSVNKTRNYKDVKPEEIIPLEQDDIF